MYERAGGYPASVSGTLALGVGWPSARVLLFGASAPATMAGSMGRQGADRQAIGLRVEGVRVLTQAWALVGAVAASRQRLVRTWVAPLPDGGLDVIVPPGPGQLSNDFLSWSGSGFQLGVGAERRLSRRLHLRLLAGAVLTTGQGGNWERFTATRGGTRVAPTLELGLLSAFGQRW